MREVEEATAVDEICDVGGLPPLAKVHGSDCDLEDSGHYEGGNTINDLRFVV